MAYLNWKQSADVKVNRSEPEPNRFQLELALAAPMATELCDDLEQAFAPGGAELKIDLPENWTLYLKSKPGLSRLQLAHPENDQWVGTVILGPEHATGLVASLRQLISGASSDQPVAISRLGALSTINNLEVVVRLA